MGNFKVYLISTSLGQTPPSASRIVLKLKSEALELGENLNPFHMHSDPIINTHPEQSNYLHNYDNMYWVQDTGQTN